MAVDIKRLAAVTSAYTGYLAGEFQFMHEYVEELLGRPVWTHEFGTQSIVDEVREKSKEDFIRLWKEAIEAS